MPRASTAETGPAMVGPGGARIRGGRPRGGQLGRAHPAGPGRRRAAADGASNFFRAASAASGLAFRARSGRRRERAVACFFGWVPGPAAAGARRARVGSKK